MRRLSILLLTLVMLLLLIGCGSEMVEDNTGNNNSPDSSMRPSEGGSVSPNSEITPANDLDKESTASEDEFKFDPSLAGESVASGSCGENVIWTLYSDGTMVINGTGDMKPQLWRVFESWDDCEKYEDQVIQLIIEDGITSIADSAFTYFTSLQNVVIADSVTSIGVEAFRSCWSLTSIDIPDGVVAIEGSAFFDCRGLIEVRIPSSVTSIGNSTFDACEALQSIYIPDGVETIGWGMFARCSSLESIGIPASVTTIEPMAFLGCNSLTDVYYEGSEAEWSAIVIEETDAKLLESMGYSAEDDECLTRAEIHYDSTMP